MKLLRMQKAKKSAQMRAQQDSEPEPEGDSVVKPKEPRKSRTMSPGTQLSVSAPRVTVESGLAGQHLWGKFVCCFGESAQSVVCIIHN